MWPYWLLFLIPAFALLSPVRVFPVVRNAVWLLVGLFFAVAIGLRHQVGGDWRSYLAHLERAANSSFAESLLSSDPGYVLLNWVVAHLGGSIYWVNFFCGLIVMTGLIRFCRRQPLPWLALLVAVPYLIVVVSMGYSRQAVALGFALLALVALGDGRLRSFVTWVFVGAAFHKSAVLLLPIAGLAASQNRLQAVLWASAASLIGGYIFLFDSVDALWASYVEADFQSQGGLIRVLMNAVPAALFLSLHKKLSLSDWERRLWWWMSFAALTCVPLVLMSSTATDRVALYLIPVQIFVFSRLHNLSDSQDWRTFIVLAITLYYSAVLAVWLNFAANSSSWVPYQMLWLL